MKTITVDQIEHFDAMLEGFSEEEVQETMLSFADQQPYLLVYLMACGDELPEEQQEQLLYMGFRIWFCYYKVFGKRPKVSEKKIDQVEQHNLQMLEYFSSEDEAGINEGLSNVLEGYNQRELLTKMVSEVLSEEAALASLESQGTFFAALKVTIECLDE